MKLICKAGYWHLKRLLGDDEGAALIVTLGAFMFMFMLCCGIYAIGESVRQKVELQNAADAASYSAAVIQADTLSRIATLNRAMSWTYVQMTRRQMDYIVDKWLGQTVKIWSEDNSKVEAWHRLSVFTSPLHVFKDCDMGHGGRQPDTYWVGKDSENDFIVHLNGLSDVFTSILPGLGALNSLPMVRNMGFGRDVDIRDIDIKSVRGIERIGIINARNRFSDARNRFSAVSPQLPFNHINLSYESGNHGVMWSSNLGAQILSSNLGAQILCDKANILAMNMAEVDLVLQMPGRISNAVKNVIRNNLPEDEYKDNQYQYYLYQNEQPYTYFRLLNNTKEDERIFLSFSDNYEEQLHKTFLKEMPKPPPFANDPKFANDPMSSSELLGMQKKLGLNITGGIDRWFVRGNGTRRAQDTDLGIQRCYKHWAEDLLKSLHPTKYIPILPPSNLNFNGDKNEPSKLTFFSFNIKQPYPSIGLYSEWRWYSMIWFCLWEPDFLLEPDKHDHIDICSMFWCPHTSLALKIRRGKNCMIWPQISIRNRTSYRYKRGSSLRIRRRTVNTGGSSFTRMGLPVIGGYTRVYGDDDMIYDENYYVGAKCMPLILSPTFFGKPGALVVGISKKNANPFAKIMSVVSGGIFSKFSHVVPYTWAISASRAGYMKYNGKAGGYHVGWTDPSRLEERWNLKQSDWDAVFLPVRDAWNLCVDSAFVPETGRVFSLGSSEKNALLDMMRNEQGTRYHWNEIEPPAGMHGDSKNLDWEDLSEKLFH